MPKALPLDCQFVQFLLTRSDPFLVRYASLSQPQQWRRRVEEQQLPHWQELEFHDPEMLSQQIQQFVELTFGAGRLPMLRRRYATERHRQGKQTRSVELSNELVERLEKIKASQGLPSFTAAIEWLEAQTAVR
ncbi:hypothetical protein [Ferrimonas marina]|uniref:Uncharacterized protein n=1 Tax=Ferrimonas marina TaxID=299255 RepID=A0A1M5NFD4_9GAMM|nr:hypothetical protein [Ferrimonas marina]SHG87899.1 hypothetical protein SAMN02745129_1019 [Ferrimonas marina]